MIASMTGFARREISGPWGSLICELRSVNHRFLEASLRLPEELRSAERELRQHLGSGLHRGKVDCTVTLRRAQASEAGLEVDSQALEQLLARLKDIGRSFPAHTVNRRGRAALARRSQGGNRQRRGADDRRQGALRRHARGPGRRPRAEGARLREILEQRCAALEEHVRQVRQRLPEVQTKLRARLDERLRELAASVDQDRLEQELALLLQRLDVDEELDRLAGHVAGDPPHARRPASRPAGGWIS